MSGLVSPCDWPLLFPKEDGYGATGCPSLDRVTPAVRDAVISAATSMLWNWTGRQFGLCEVTVRPCRDDCGKNVSTYRGRTGVPLSGLYRSPWTPVLIGGDWFNLSCGQCANRCKCDGAWSIRLPGPIDSVTAVTIDGVVLDPSAYRVDNRSILTRQDGDEWPECQDMDKPAGEVDTWSVTYQRGLPVPEHGQIAAGVLACELASAAVGADCRLPQRIQTITREGISVGVLDTFDNIKDGATGIWLIDSWVASVVHRPKRSLVLDPDNRARRRIETSP